MRRHLVRTDNGTEESMAAADGVETTWQGAHGQPLLARHEHEPLGEPMPLDLVPTGGTCPRLPLAPFLSIQRCGVCREHAVFFLDKRKALDRLELLEYERGHALAIGPIEHAVGRKNQRASVVSGSMV